MNKLEELLERYPELSACAPEVERAFEALLETYRRGGKVLACGNGGSAADCEHIVGELMKGFLLPRPITGELESRIEAAFPGEGRNYAAYLQQGIPAISLPSQTAVLSAYVNDVHADYVYAQLVQGYGRPEDVLLCLSTSGNSRNVVRAARMAKVLGMRSVALTGSRGCTLDEICDVVIKVPETETFKVQELHLPVYHYLCARLEEELFG